MNGKHFVFFIILCSSAVLGQSAKIFSDSASFLLFVNKEPIGKNKVVLNSSGKYEREFNLKMSGQELKFKMTCSSIYASPAHFVIDNPTTGKIDLEIGSDSAFYQFKNTSKTEKLPDNYFFYDDYGSLFESLLFKEYDMTKGGSQSFQRYRISESSKLQNTKIEVSIQYLGFDTLFAKGRKWTFRKFDWEVFGIHATYWIDNQHKIYKIYSEYDNSVGIREGFEELLDFKIKTDSVIKESIMIKMNDGVSLSTDLYFPQSEPKNLPVVLMRTPYKKEMQELKGKFWAEKGYVCAIQDVRGRFESEGEWEPFINEGKDGYETIEWLAAQDWCSGKVGMIGPSYLGWAQFLAAIEKPPHLVTIIPSVTPPDPFYNLPYENGAFFTLGSLWWLQLIESEATSELSGKGIYEITNKDYAALVKSLPVIELDKKFFGGENSTWRNWITHNTNDDYWQRASYLNELNKLDIPVFLQSGWFDTNGIGSKLAYQKLKEADNKNVKLVLGPWNHTDKASSIVNGHFVGEEAAIDLELLFERWFEYHLKGIDNGIMHEPLVQVYLINSNKWLYDDSYPLAKTKNHKLYFGSKNSALSLNGDGFLSRKSLKNGKEFDEYIYDPGNPTPSPNQRYKEGGRKNYLEITANRSDILIYESPSLNNDLTIVGPVSATIYVSTSAFDTDWFVTLQAVNSGGGTIPLGKAALRASYSESVSQKKLLEPDKVYCYHFDLWQTGITLKKGYKLRAEITSAYFPEFSRNLNTGENNETNSDYISAKQRIYHSEEYPSHLQLPVYRE
jgi:putative CocE/NonD family hydrolase